MSQPILEAALKRSAAETYPYLPVCMWTTRVGSLTWWLSTAAFPPRRSIGSTEYSRSRISCSPERAGAGPIT